MIQHGENIIAGAGKYLQSGRIKGLKMPACREYEEFDINIDNIKEVNDLYFVDGLIVVKDESYAAMKTKLVNSIYSNDDQIAIMLNDNKEQFDLMQAWREWFSILIKRIKGIDN